MNQPIFISYSSKDADVVDKLRKALQLNGQLPWLDSRQLVDGDNLIERIDESIDCARHFLVVVSIDSLGSDWVQREIATALRAAKHRTDGFKVIPVVLPGIGKNLLKLLLPDEFKAIFIKDTTTGLDDAMQELFVALGL